MDVRDAVEADAGQLAELADQPADVMRNLVHDRTVRVASEPAAAAERGSAADDAESAGAEVGELGADGEAVRGFVSFDARRDAVHVTQLEGSPEACERLLREPTRFAEREGMAVELLAAQSDDQLRDAAEAAGFEEDGPGPRFGGTPTMRYRLVP